MSLGDIIASIRQEAGLTQSEMAKRLYVTRQTVSRWENGETTPSIDTVKLIAVSLMATLLPHLKRWKEVEENESRYGKELRDAIYACAM